MKTKDVDVAQRGRRMRASKTAIRDADRQVAEHRKAAISAQIELEERRAAGEDIAPERFAELIVYLTSQGQRTSHVKTTHVPTVAAKRRGDG